MSNYQERLSSTDPLVSIEAEMCLLGSMLLSDSVCKRMTALAKPEIFWRRAHQLIFGAIQELVELDSGVDYLTVKRTLGGNLEEVGGDDYILQLAEYVPSPANYSYHFQVVQNLHMRRKLVQLGHDIEHDSWAGDTDALYAFLQPSTASSPFPVADVDIDARKSRETLATGISAIDLYTGGLDVGETGVCLMGSGVGKTNFLVGRALHAAMLGHGVTYISLSDLDEEAIKRRMMRMMTGWSYAPNGGQPLEDWTKAKKELDALNVHLHATFTYRGGNKLQNLLALMTEAKRRRGCKMIVLDYVQMLEPEGKSDYAHSVHAEREIRLLTNRLKICTWLGSQVTDSEFGPKVKGGVHWQEGSALTVIGEKMPQKVLDEKRTGAEFKARTEGYEPIAMRCPKARHCRAFKPFLAGVTDKLEFVEL